MGKIGPQGVCESASQDHEVSGPTQWSHWIVQRGYLFPAASMSEPSCFPLPLLQSDWGPRHYRQRVDDYHVIYLLPFR